ncbi:MAG: hypothetical protein II625_02540 [Bacilli bacterium]|nr:hypothetical protein [Bacilli bacterium]
MAKESYLDGSLATTALKGIEEVYSGIIGELNKIQSEAIDKITAGWKGQDCVDFISKNVIPAVNSVSDEIQKIFQSVNDTITQNAQNYERKFLKGQTVFNRVAHNMKKVTVNCPPPFTGTIIGITDEAKLELAKNYLKRMQQQLLDLLNRAKKYAANSGFYGGGQQQKIDSSMKSIATSISNLVNEFGNAVSKVATTAVTDAEELAKKNAGTF